MVSSPGSPRIGIFAKDALPLSQTFVADHLRGLSRHEASLLACRHVGAGLVSRNETTLLARGTAGIAMAVATGVVGGRARRLLRDVELVHSHFLTESALVLPVVRRARLPLVVTAHGYDATVHAGHRREGLVGALQEGRRPDVVSYASRIVCVSRYIADVLVEESGVPRGKLVVVPNGVPSALLDAVVENDVPSILFVGRLVEKKGIGDLLAAFEDVLVPIPDAVLDVVGAGPMESEVRRQAEASGGRIRCHGPQPRARVLDMIRRSRLVAVPSMRAANGDNEGMPIIALEAMASARPVVCYRQGPMVELFDDGIEGFFAEPGDPGSLAKAMTGLLFDSGLADDMGLEARRRVAARHTIERQMSDLEAIYDDVLR